MSMHRIVFVAPVILAGMGYGVALTLDDQRLSAHRPPHERHHKDHPLSYSLDKAMMFGKRHALTIRVLYPADPGTTRGKPGVSTAPTVTRY